MANDDDAATVERLREGDEAAFAALVDRYHGRLVRLALLFVADRATAEEVAQDAWLGVLAGIDRFEGRSTLKTWIFRILTNRARTRSVRERRTVPMSALGEDGAAVDPDRFTAGGRWAAPPRPWDDRAPEDALVRKEGIAHLDAALATLPENQRAVLVLRDVAGLDAAEACNILEITATNQRVLLHRARSRLRRAYEDYLARR